MSHLAELISNATSLDSIYKKKHKNRLRTCPTPDKNGTTYKHPQDIFTV